MVVEFLRVFGDLFDLQDEFPDGVSLGQRRVCVCVCVNLPWCVNLCVCVWF